MITPELEKLILNGSAQYMNYAMGGSGVGTIPFPKGKKYMVLVDFYWHPFYDEDLILQTSPFALSQKIIHTMTLWNKSTKSVFNFRDAFFKDTNAELPQAVPQFTPGFQYHCFIQSKEDIYIDIYNFAASPQIVWNSAIIPARTQEQLNPNGYQGIRTIRSIQTPTAGISSLGYDRDPNGLAKTIRTREQFFDDITNVNALVDPAASAPSNLQNQYSFPLVNFGIVIVNKTNTAKDRQ